MKEEGEDTKRTFVLLYITVKENVEVRRYVALSHNMRRRKVCHSFKLVLNLEKLASVH